MDEPPPLCKIHLVPCHCQSQSEKNITQGDSSHRPIYAECRSKCISARVGMYMCYTSECNNTANCKASKSTREGPGLDMKALFAIVQ